MYNVWEGEGGGGGGGGGGGQVYIVYYCLASALYYVLATHNPYPWAITDTQCTKCTPHAGMVSLV